MTTLLSIIPWIVAACWAAFIIYWMISSVGIKRDINRSTWYRLWWVRVVIAFVIIGWLWDRSSLGELTKHSFLFTFSPTSSFVLASLGAVFSIAGIALAIWARVHLGRNWSPAPAIKEEHELVTSGPYVLIRHPIYTGVILATLGSIFVSPTWLIMFVVVSAMFIWRVHVEERLMLQQFPDQYPGYKKRTYALIPWIW